MGAGCCLHGIGHGKDEAISGPRLKSGWAVGCLPVREIRIGKIGRRRRSNENAAMESAIVLILTESQKRWCFCTSKRLNQLFDDV
jgi:hypothetical protein